MLISICKFALDLDKTAEDLLKDMAKQTMSDQAKGNITVGIFVYLLLSHV